MDNFWKRITPAVLLAITGATFLHFLDRPTNVPLDTTTGDLAKTSGEARNSNEPATSGMPNPSPVGTAPSTAPITAPGPDQAGPSSAPAVQTSTRPTRPSTSPAGPSTTPTSSAGEPSTTPTPPVSRTIAGDAVMTRYGVAQVEIRVDADGKITDVIRLRLPSGGRPEYSRFAEPKLRAEVLAAQSANVDMVSGATYTSAGYLKSLQSALDKLRQP